MTDVDTTDDRASVPNGRPRRLTMLLGVAFLLLLALFWAWIWYYQLTNQGEQNMPDRLDDLAWTSQAAEICTAAEARVAALPGAHTSASADDRADVIDAATDEIELMLVEIERIVPRGSSRDALLAAAWIADYRIFLDDRYTFADTLRTDPGARFVVTEKYGSHITAPVDRFARVNEMEACMTSGDV